MPISGDKWDILSLQLVAGMTNFVRGFCLEKKISQNEIPEIVGCNILNRFARDLKLKVKVEEITEEFVTVTVAKETPLEILNKLATEAPNNEEAKSLSFCERDLLY